MSCLARTVWAAVPKLPAIALWSEVCQELKLNDAETAAVTAETPSDGIDCPVRPGGQVLPEHVEEGLRKLVDVLTQHQRGLLLITTDIRNVKTAHAEKVLRTAAGLGVKHYRLGYWKASANNPAH